MTSFWLDNNTCIAQQCYCDKYFYQQMGSPPIVVYDEVKLITVFHYDNEVAQGSVLDMELRNEIKSRFPEPSLLIRSIGNVQAIFDDSRLLYKQISSVFPKEESEL